MMNILSALFRLQRVSYSIRNLIQFLTFGPVPVMRAKCYAKSVAHITGNNVQMGMKYLLPCRLAVCEPDIYSFASDAALAQRRSETLRDAEHLRALFFFQLRKITGMSIGDYERVPWIDGLMIQESRAAIILINHADFNLACNQLANYTVVGFVHGKSTSQGCLAFTSWPKPVGQFFTRQCEVGGHFSQNGRQSSNPQRIVTGNC
jgi:hypothetical protein